MGVAAAGRGRDVRRLGPPPLHRLLLLLRMDGTALRLWREHYWSLRRLPGKGCVL